MKGLLLLLLLLPAKPDPQFNGFRPDAVKTFSCTVESVDVYLNGSNISHEEVYVIAKATYKEGSLWSQTLAELAYTTPNWHKGEKICSKWRDKAEKLVRAARTQ